MIRVLDMTVWDRDRVERRNDVSVRSRRRLGFLSLKRFLFFFVHMEGEKAIIK